MVSFEAWAVAALTLVAALLRLWGFGRLGLVHFDEGIYALAGLWSVSGAGLAGLDPTVIAYAPGGFPFLVGLSYLFVGISGPAAILVSVAAGTLTVPASAWLAYRTYGTGAGVLTAALAALSGFHVAFSRMAITDASFLLAWVVGLISAQRFLERPGAGRGALLGLCVGLAQWFKYSGWLLGAVVVVSAFINLILHPGERSPRRVLRVWGYGLLAAIVAGLTYAPWFVFVEAHGGYSRLLAHHRGYLGGLESWRPHLRQQLVQGALLSGGAWWNLAGLLAAVGGFLLVRFSRGWRPDRKSWRVSAQAALLLTFAGLIYWFWWYWWQVAFWRIGVVSWWLLPWQRTQGQRLLSVTWLVLSAMTPFYHPYARLWLPLHQLGWVLLAGLVVMRACDAGSLEASLDSQIVRSPRRWPVRAWAWIVLSAIVLVVSSPGGAARPMMGDRDDRPGLLAPSDSLHRAVGRLLTDLPREVSGLRLLARPAVTFELGGRIAVLVEPNLERLMVAGDPRHWALVDAAQLRQEGDLGAAVERLLEAWELVHEYPTTLNLPTLLDVDPGAAATGSDEAANAPLWLLRVRRPGVSR
jgi:hypothetical protein